MHHRGMRRSHAHAAAHTQQRQPTRLTHGKLCAATCAGSMLTRLLFTVFVRCASAASVLKRNCLGATQALEALAVEELIRQWKIKEDDARRFSGKSNSINRAAIAEKDAAAAAAASSAEAPAAAAPAAEVQYTVSRGPAPAPGAALQAASAAAIYRVPAGGSDSLVPLVAAANAAAVARESINIQVPHQNYPGVGRDEVAIPFLLFGKLNLKTGDVLLQKVHVKWAYNDISYAGRMIGVVVDAQGVESEMPLAMLLHQMDAFMRGEKFDVPIQALRMDLRARWSSASLAFIARPPPEPEQPVASASASASSSSSSYPAASSAHSLASPVFSPPPASPVRSAMPSAMVFNSPAPPAPSQLPSLGASLASPSSSASPGPKVPRSPSPSSASSSSSSSSSSSITPRLAKHESAGQEAAAASMSGDAAADADSAPHA